MTRNELKQFLHQYTEYEKILYSILQNGLDAEEEVPSSDDQDSLYPNLSREEIISNITNYMENPGKYSTLNENLFITSGNRLSFFIHPRIFNTDCTAMEHRHSFIELIYVYSGQCCQTIRGNKMTLNEGDICILNTSVSHSITIRNKNDIVVNCLMSKSYFDTAFLGRLSGNDVLSDFFIRAVYLDKSLNDYILFHSGKNEKVRLILDEILCEYYDSRMCSTEVINAYMIILFSELLRDYKKEVNTKNYTQLRYTMISDIILYLQQNYKEATLASTAQYFNFHPTYLSQVFKKITGVGFKEFLQQAKLERACTLLLETNDTIEEIANDIGYLNMSFFYRLFKERYHLTPHEFRLRGSKTGS